MPQVLLYKKVLLGVAVVSRVYLLLEGIVLIFANKDAKVDSQSVLLIEPRVVDSDIYIRLLYIL